jgi:hypothetical protein
VEAAPPPVPSEPVPVAVDTGEGRAPSKGAPVALIVAAVVVLGIVGLAAAVGVAWKSGVLERFTGSRGGGSEQAELTGDQSAGDAAVSDQWGTAEDAPDVEPGDQPAAEADVAAMATTDSAGQTTVDAAAGERPQVEAAEVTAAADTHASATVGQAQEQVSGHDAAHQQQAIQRPPPQRPPPGRQITQERRQLEPERPAAPAPRGMVVVAVGETLLAGEAESFLERALTRLGARVVDEDAIPALMGRLGEPPDRDPGYLMEQLRPYARNILIVNAEYLGQRQLRYMGRSDVAFQSRLKLVAVDMTTDQALGNTFEEKVEYTHLSVGRVVEEKLRPVVRRIARLAGGGG